MKRKCQAISRTNYADNNIDATIAIALCFSHNYIWIQQQVEYIIQTTAAKDFITWPQDLIYGLDPNFGYSRDACLVSKLKKLFLCHRRC